MKTDIIFGIHSLIEAIKSGKEIEKIYLKKGLQGELFTELFQLVKKTSIPYQIVPIERINRISRKNHQGVLALISPIIYQDIENLIPSLYETGKEPFLLILDGITDVRNFGAITRTAECAGINGIIIPAKGSAQINADAMKTSAGALNTIPICRTINLLETIEFVKNSGIQIIAATERADDFYYDADYKKPTAIILGSEDTGISYKVLKLADQQVKIPILGKIESLNVSVAASIVVYEAVKQRIK